MFYPFSIQKQVLFIWQNATNSSNQGTRNASEGHNKDKRNSQYKSKLETDSLVSRPKPSRKVSENDECKSGNGQSKSVIEQRKRDKDQGKAINDQDQTASSEHKAANYVMRKRLNLKEGDGYETSDEGRLEHNNIMLWVERKQIQTKKPLDALAKGLNKPTEIVIEVDNGYRSRSF